MQEICIKYIVTFIFIWFFFFYCYTAVKYQFKLSFLIRYKSFGFRLSVSSNVKVHLQQANKSAFVRVIWNERDEKMGNRSMFFRSWILIPAPIVDSSVLCSHKHCLHHKQWRKSHTEQKLEPRLTRRETDTIFWNHTNQKRPDMKKKTVCLFSPEVRLNETFAWSVIRK